MCLASGIDTDPDLDPAKWCRSVPIQILINNTGSRQSRLRFPSKTATQPWYSSRPARCTKMKILPYIFAKICMFAKCENGSFVFTSPIRCSCRAGTQKRKYGNYWTNRQNREIIRRQQCCWPGILVPDQNMFHSGSRIQGQKDSGFRIRILIKKFKYFNPKIVSQLLEYDHGSGFWFFTLSGSRIQGSKRHWIPDPDPQHWKSGSQGMTDGLGNQWTSHMRTLPIQTYFLSAACS